MKDLRGDAHRLIVKVLGTEETWNTPSLILATDTCCNGIALFSQVISLKFQIFFFIDNDIFNAKILFNDEFQVHLDVDPNLYEHDDIKFAALRKSDEARLEIFSDLLATQLGLIVQNRATTTNMFPNAYFLGRHEVRNIAIN